MSATIKSHGIKGKILAQALFLLMVLGLAACSSGSNDIAPVETTTVQGQVINGPLVGAEVHIYDSEGKLLGSTTTDEHGDYELDVAAIPPYRIVTQGGLLNGVAYLGSMQAWCATDILCDATPFTTALLAVMEMKKLNQDDAMDLLAGMLGIEFDPFTDPNTPPGSFPLDDVREAIGNGGINLESWVDSVVAWVEDPSQPAPGGLQSYSVTPSAGTGGSISPNTAQNVNHGATTSFTFAPNTGYSIAAVDGCGGSLAGNTYTTGAITANCAVTASFSLNSYTVTPSAGANGSISPDTAQAVNHGATTSFILAPDIGYSIDAVDGCDGSLVGDTYTTGAITANCAVTASFILSYTVTPSAGTGGSISPDTAQTVNHGATTSFILAPDIGYSIDAVSGCDGSLAGNTYTTGAITADCTVTASFSLNSYTVTPSAGANGSIDPATAQTVNHGATTSFILTPSDNYTIDSITGTCGGTLDGNTYSTDAITANCTVVASFIALGPQDPAVTAGHQVNLAWAPVAGATDYCVYVSDSTGINLATAASYDMGLSACTGNTDTRYTTTSLSHGTRYYFVVTAKIGADESGVSTEVSAMPVSRPMNDTGIDWCADNTINNLTCPQEGFVGQDGDHGRDADGSLIKVGGGHAGFDFTKVCNSGELAGEGTCPNDPALGGGNNDWACTLDNHTGLMWEVKVDDSTSLRHMGHTYTWYNSDPATNGGSIGTPNGGTCVDATNCDTEKFVAAVNAAALCGASDWRMPDSRELLSIVHNDRVSPAIDTGWFPNTPSSWFWSSSPYASFAGNAWFVHFSLGSVDWDGLSLNSQVRLVRAGQ